MITDAGADTVCSREPTLLTRACLVCAALLPWFAVFSGIFGLYFFVILAAMLVAEWLFFPVLFLAAPLAFLLLLIMPAGLIYAALRGPTVGWMGRLTRAGCLVSMGFALVYASLTAVVAVGDILQEGVSGVGELFSVWWMAVLILGLWATWRAWRWLRRHPVQG